MRISGDDNVHMSMIAANRLGRWLGSFRKHRGEDLAEVVQRLWNLVGAEPAGQKRLGWLVPDGAWRRANMGAVLVRLERGSVRGDIANDQRMDLLGAYGVGEVMVAPLVARPGASIAISHRLADFTDCGVAAGRLASYRFPWNCLASGNAFFVQLILERKGLSDQHSHPGLEFMVCIRGDVEIRMHSSGIRCRMQRGDYVHFLSDQEHSVVNLGRGRAKLLIMRFMDQEGGPTMRVRAFAEDFTRKLAHPDRKGAKTMYVQEVRPWIRQMVSGPGGALNVGDWRLRDPVGLARYIEALATRTPARFSTRALASHAAKLGYAMTRDYFAKIRRAEAPEDLCAASLEMIARVLDVRPPLLAHFLAPRAPYFALVRREVDWVDIPAQLGDSQGGVYTMPRYNLADSDCSIATLRLDCGRTSMSNAHPGYEVAIPMNGRGVVEFPDANQQGYVLDAKNEVFVHYRSDELHQIRNTGDETLELLVLRFP